MNIALVFPRSTFLIDPKVYPPLGLWYIAAQLEHLGHHTEFFDLSTDSLPEDGEFDQIWVSATSSQMSEVRRLDRLFNTYSKTKTVLGGPAVWSTKGHLNLHNFDELVSGEVDHPEAIQMILNNREHVVVPPPPTDTSYMLSPIRRWAHRYTATLTGRNGYPRKTTTMITTRGCPWRCAFCETGRLGTMVSKVRFEPLDMVIDQIREIYDLGFRGIQFYDDALPIKKDRTYEIMAALNSFEMSWRCFFRSDLAIHNGFEFLRDMRDSGLVEVLVGVESGSDQIKANIFKGTTIKQDTQVLEWCKELGIKFKASLIFGLPGESVETMQQSLDWILTNRPDRVDVNILLPLPGTPITNNMDEYDLYCTAEVPEEYWFKGDQHTLKSLVGTSHLEPREIEEFHARAVEQIAQAKIPY